MMRFAILLLCSMSACVWADVERPNVVFILADDMGVGDVSHTSGLAATPHVDRMAAEGMRFTDAHTSSSVCTPTRYSILTGRYNWRSPLKKSVLFGLDAPLIPGDRLTVAGFLKQQGYRTAVVGKWHLGLGWHKLPDGQKREAEEGPTKGGGWDIDYTRQVDGGPLALGFDESFIIPASLDMFPYVYLKDDTPTEVATVTKKWLRAGPAGKEFEAVNCLRDFAREARGFIAGAAGGKQPFFLYLPLTSPHTPIIPSKKWQGKSEIGAYGDFLMETDWVVGEVLAELAKQGVSDNTMVVFTTDNGCSPEAKIDQLEKKGHLPNGKLRGTKADVFEGGHRVPFVVRWPAAVKAGRNCDKTITSMDLFATMAELTGSVKKVPVNAAEDSFSFAGELTGSDGDGRSVRPFTIHHSFHGTFAIREGKWKLIVDPSSGGWSAPQPRDAVKDPSLPVVQLYDLEADLAETTNVHAEHPEVVKAMVDTLVKAIRDGRTTPGPKQSNEGYPDTFAKRVLDAWPQLRR